jgi:hypothetical protein
MNITLAFTVYREHFLKTSREIFRVVFFALPTIRDAGEFSLRCFAVNVIIAGREEGTNAYPRIAVVVFLYLRLGQRLCVVKLAPTR